VRPDERLASEVDHLQQQIKQIKENEIEQSRVHDPKPPPTSIEGDFKTTWERNLHELQACVAKKATQFPKEFENRRHEMTLSS
jgi:hypothetical protein